MASPSIFIIEGAYVELLFIEFNRILVKGDNPKLNNSQAIQGFFFQELIRIRICKKACRK